MGDVSFEQEGPWEELVEAEVEHKVKEEILFAERGESTLNRANLGSKDAETPIGTLWIMEQHGHLNRWESLAPIPDPKDNATLRGRSTFSSCSYWNAIELDWLNWIELQWNWIMQPWEGGLPFQAVLIGTHHWSNCRIHERVSKRRNNFEPQCGQHFFLQNWSVWLCCTVCESLFQRIVGCFLRLCITK